MKHFFRLTVFQMYNRYGFAALTAGAGAKNERGKQLGRAILMVFLFCYFGALSSFLSYQMYQAASAAGYEELVMSLFFLAGMLVSLAFGIIFAIGIFYMSADSEFLATLPVGQGAVFASKFAQLYLSELFVVLLLTAPMAIIHGVFHGGVVYFFKALLTLLFLPVIPLLAASLLAMLLMKLVGGSRHREALITGGSILLMVGVIVGQNQLQRLFVSGESGAVLLSSQSGLIGALTSCFPPAGWAARSLASQGAEGALHLLLFVGVSAAALVLTVLLSSRSYVKRSTLMLETAGRTRKSARGARAERKGLEKTPRKPLLALYVKEWLTVLRAPTYVLNSMIGILLGPLLLALVILQPGTSGALSKALPLLSQSENAVPVILAAAGCLVFIAVTNILPSTAISREAPTFWIMKTIPVEMERQILAKYLMCATVSALSVLVTAIAAAILLPIPLPYLLVAVLIALFYGFAVCSVGLIIDMAKPKWNWSSETEAVKQNMNGMITMFGAMLIGALVGGAGYLLFTVGANGALVVAALLGLCLILAVALYFLMLRQAAGNRLEQ